MTKERKVNTMHIGIQSGATTTELSYAEAYALYKEAGFESIDININNEIEDEAAYRAGRIDEAGSIFDRPMDEILEHFVPEFTEIEKNGLEIGQAHAPFPTYIPGKPDSLERISPIIINSLKFCQIKNIPYLVVHGVKDPKLPQETLDAYNDRLYSSLIPTLLEGNTVVCAENLWNRDPENYNCLTPAHGSNADAICAFLDDLNARAGREVFGLCLDTGHLNLLGLDPIPFIHKLGKRIKVLHIHDNNGGPDDQHLAPYTGTLNFDALMQALADVGYAGDLSFETFRQTSLEKIPQALLLPWLKHICTIGQYFRTFFR